MASTNVLQIPGFSQIPYRIFIVPLTNTKSAPAPTTLANDLRRTQISLLRRCELVSIKNGELWTFSKDGVQSAPAPDEGSGLQEISTGTLFASQLLTLGETPPQSVNTQTFRNGAAHEQFLSSIRALIEFRFLQLPGYHILGNWLIPPPTDDLDNDDFRSLLPALQSPSLRRDVFRLSINLAANGKLYITPDCNSSLSLQPLNMAQLVPEGSALYISPSGQLVEFISLLPSTPQTTSILQKIRVNTGLEAKPPMIQIRLPSGLETLWPANLSFQKIEDKKLSSIDNIDYFNLKDGVSSAVKLISEALTYKPPPAPSPAIPPAVAAHIPPSGVYHTPPDGIIRTKPAPDTVQNPTVNQTNQEDWSAPSREEDFWPSMDDSRADEEDFLFDGIEDTLDVQEEDFNFFDDDPSGEFDAAETIASDIPKEEEQVALLSEEKTQPMEDVKMEKSTPPLQIPEPQLILSPPCSPLRILPSPPPTRRGTFPKTWDHVRLSGNLEKIQDKYRRGGKYWCDDLDEHVVTDDSLSSSSSDDEGMDMMSSNPRKRKRNEDDELSSHRLSGSGLAGTQNLDSGVIMVMVRAIDENLSLLLDTKDDLFKLALRTDEKLVDYANGLDDNGFNALIDIVANQVSWDGLGLFPPAVDHQNLPTDDFTSVVTNIWGVDTPNNLGLRELTDVTDVLPSFDKEESSQLKTPRMKPAKSSHSHNASPSLVLSMEQTQSMYPIPSPQFSVHRILNRNSPAPSHIQRLSISPPALRFWEKFSFSPVAGEKEVWCYVVHPESEGMLFAIDIFLTELQTAWEACGMGKFERGRVTEGGRNGIITVNVSQPGDEEAYLAGYQDALVSFGRGLLTLEDTWLKNILILMVNPFRDASAIIPLCRAFLSFRSTFFAGVDNPSLVPASNVALQIVPAGMVACKEGIFTRGLEFQSFLRGLYDRCRILENTAATNSKPATRTREFLTSPATLIASPPANALEFTNLFPVQHRCLLKDNSSLHVAYSISKNSRWVTAVWTDDWGFVSLKESFCLSRLATGNKPQHELPLENAFEKIWHLTVEIAKPARVNWKVIITSVGGMSKNEIGIWNALKEEHSSELLGQVQLLLASIDLNPPLSVSLLNTGPVVASPVATISTPYPSAAAFSQSSPAAMGNAYGTPAATPLAQANESPDPSGAIMSTPGGTANTENVTEFDPEARWVDATDEVWGVVLNHRVPTCQNTDPEKEVRFSLASGFLWPIKSTLPHNLIQVHLLHIDKPQTVSQSSSPENPSNTCPRETLKQLLLQFRGLASLGVVRGVSSPDKMVPWHVIAAERINDIFSSYM